MKKLWLFILFFAGIFLYTSENCLAQKNITYTPGTVLQITLQDGSQISGNFVSQDDQTLIVKSASMGKITIEKSKIKSIKQVSEVNVKKGKVWFENPNPYKYLMGSSAIPKPAKIIPQREKDSLLFMVFSF